MATSWFLGTGVELDNLAPINTVAPVVSGTVAEDELLSCTTGTWTGTTPITYTYQWYRVLYDDEESVLLDEDGHALGSIIVGARSSTYTVEGIPIAPESTWNEADNLNLILSNGNLTATVEEPGSSAQAGCGRGTQARSTGKRYYEITINATDIDIALPIGLCDDTHTLAVASMPGYHDNTGFILFATTYVGGTLLTAQTQSAIYFIPAVVFATNDVISFAVDLDLHLVWVAQNGTWIGAGGAPGVGPGLDWGDLAGPAMKIFGELNSSGADFAPIITMNTGASAFAYTIPTGYVAWETAE